MENTKKNYNVDYDESWPYRVKIMQLLHGIAISDALEILKYTMDDIKSWHPVDTTNPLFVQNLKEGVE